MTKRNGTFTEMKFKKLKTDNDFDDLWGDDPSIDDCLIQATQVCEQNGVHQSNISILPNYSHFEQADKGIFTSTQKVFNGSVIGPTKHINVSNNYVNKTNIANGNLPLQSKDQLETEVKNLKEKYECKEGEVSILRIQLKEARISMETEQQKKDKEWAEKLNAANKEIKLVRSELDFKNLEVGNLKNKILEISKAYTMDNLYNNSQKITSHKKGDVNIYTFYTKDYKLEPVLDAKYPLMNSIPLTMFKSGQTENFFINLKPNQACDFLNENADNEIVSKYKKIIESKHFNLDSILCDVSALVKFNSMSINMQLSYHHIDNILSVSKSTLRSLHNYLLVSEGQIQNEDEAYLKHTCDADNNSNFSAFDSRPWCSREIGIRARQTVRIIAEILPHSSYMQNNLFNGVSNELITDNEDIDNYLILISVIINAIHKTKKTQFCNGFLCAVSILLYKIATVQEFSKSYVFILNMSKKLIFLKPPDIVLRNLILFFKQASVYADFDNKLCKMSKSDGTVGLSGSITGNVFGVLRTGQTNEYAVTAILLERMQTYLRNVCMIRSDSCQLPTYIVLYKQAFIEKKNLDPTLGLNTLQFINNLLNCNPPWLHYVENNNCDCVCKVVTLGIDVIYELVKNYKTKRHKIIDKKENSEQYNELLKYCLKLLHIISFRYFDIIGKYSVDSQYKFVVNYLHTLENELSLADFESEALCELHVQEEIDAIGSTRFDKIPVWK